MDTLVHSAGGMSALSVQVALRSDATETEPPPLTKAVSAAFLVLESQGRAGSVQAPAARAIGSLVMPQLASDHVPVHATVPLLQMVTAKVADVSAQATVSLHTLAAVTLGGTGMGHSADGMSALSIQVGSTSDVTETDPPPLTKLEPTIALDWQGRGSEQVLAARAIGWSVMPQSASENVPLHAALPSLQMVIAKVADVSPQLTVSSHDLLADTTAGSGTVQVSLMTDGKSGLAVGSTGFTSG
jgi:hypothetical protein